VEKSGRTTGHTTGSVAAVNVTVDVAYYKVCGVGRQVARFVDQFRVGSTTTAFSAGGDSGSLILKQDDTTNDAVGLLFAGSSTSTFANKIGNVLTPLGVSLVTRESNSHCPTPQFAGSTAAPPQAGRVPVNQQLLEAVTRVKEKHEEMLFAIPEVAGTGVGIADPVYGGLLIEVYVRKLTPAVERAIPRLLDGVPVRVIETGDIVAY